MPVIATAALTKRYPRVTALDELTVEVGPGVTGLVGANGAGKSTLLKILLGLIRPTAGSAIVLGHDVVTGGEAVRALVGYMPEHDCLPPDVSATEFVVHLGQMSGLPATAARERAADVLRHVGLDEARYRPMGGYSTGMKQRVKLAQALTHDPQLVLLDEPTNGLDPAGRDEMLTLVRRIGTEFGIPVLITSHLLGELEHVCDHIVVLDGGRLLRSESKADGSIVYLLSKPIKRYTIMLTKALVAIGCIFVLGVLPIVLAGLILDPAGFKIAVAFGVGGLLAGVTYTAIFIALSVMTGNAVTIGLLYALLWESVMGQYVNGAKMLSVQQWALAVVSKVADGNGIESAVKLPISLILLALVTIIGLSLAVSRLRSLTLSSAE